MDSLSFHHKYAWNHMKIDNAGLHLCLLLKVSEGEDYMQQRVCDDPDSLLKRESIISP
jgi:hypothetical protein